MTDKEISFLDLYRILIRNYLIILVTTILGIAGAAYVILTTPDMFRSTALIMPVTAKSGINAGGGLLGLVAQSTQASSSKRTKAYLDSYTLAEMVYKRLKNEILTNLYPENWDSREQKWLNLAGPPDEFEIVNAVKGSMTFVIETSYEDAISVTSDWDDPKLAKRVVEVYTEELESLLNDYDSRTAKKERGFYLEQFMDTQRTLLGVEMISRNLMGAYGPSSENSFVDVKLSEDRILDVYNSRENQGETKPHDVIKDVPIEVLLGYLRARQQALHAMGGQIEQQYHKRRIDSKQESLLFHIVDKPRVPLNRFKPNKRGILMMGTLFGIVAGCVIAILRDVFQLEGKFLGGFKLGGGVSESTT